MQGEDEKLENIRIKLSKKFLASKKDTVTRQTELDKYLSLFKEVSNLESFEHFSNKIIEEDTLKQLQQKYPDAYAFSTKEPLQRPLSLNERLLEHAFEELYNKKAELIGKRKLSYRSKNPSKSTTKANPFYTPRYFRNLRTRMIDNMTKVPKIRYPVEDSKLFQKEVRLSVIPRNNSHFVGKLIFDYYKRRTEQLKYLKYQYLYRWKRQTDSVSMLDRTESEFVKRITRVEKEFQYVCERVEQLSPVNLSESTPQLTQNDFQIFIRSLTYRFSCGKKVDLLCQKIKWMSHAKRFHLFNKATEFYSQLRNPSVPLMTVELKEIDSQLVELQDSFDLRKLHVDGGEEFLFTIKKRFSAVFVAQANGMKFEDYPLHEVNPKDIDQYFIDVMSKEAQKSHSNIQFSLSKVYLKKGSEEERRSNGKVNPSKNSYDSQSGFCRQEIQGIVLKEVSKNDKSLQNEIGFLRETDVTYARKRLEELVSSHFPRAYVTKEDRKKFSHEGGKSTKNKLFSVYMLRYIRVREFRKKLLDILNYFQSIKRSLMLNTKGFSVKDRKMSGFFAKTFPESDDLYNADKIMELEEINDRNDEFILENNRNLYVKDSNGIFIVYDCALEELEKRDDFLLKLGSYFIKKSAMEGTELDIDRHLIVEDLYESETWFQDGKRKVVERYFEAYQHCSDPKVCAELSKIILELVNLEPEVDFGGKYFTESYASEIISLELHHTLLKDMISTLIREERALMKGVWRKNLEDEGDLVEMFGYPEKFLVDESKTGRFSTRLLPGSVVIGYLDFYQSICKVGKVYHSMRSCLNELVKSFDIHNSIIVSSMKRLIFQQVLIEWKVLSEEERIQQKVQLKYSGSRKSLENDILLKNGEALLNIVNNISMENAFDKFLFSGSENASVETEGGFSLKDESRVLNPKKAQLYANVIELVMVLKSLIDELHETDILDQYLQEQKELIFGDDENGSKKSVLTFGSLIMSNLAISNFDKAVCDDFDVGSIAGLTSCVRSRSIHLLRHAFQYQLTHRIISSVVVKYNQYLLDDYLMSDSDNTFVTTFKDFKITKNDAIGQFLTRDEFIDDHLKRIKSEFENRSRTISDGENKEEDFLDLRLREVKCQLVNVFCTEAIKSMYCVGQKCQIFRFLKKIRRVIKLTKEDTTHVIGGPNDEIIDTIKAFREQGITKPTCMMTSDGNVIKPFYIPHFLQVMRMHGMLMDTTGSRVLFSNAFKLVFNNYILVLFLSIKSQLKRKSIENLMNPQFLGFEELKKIENQVTSVKEGNDPVKVERIMKTIIEINYHKTILTLEVLKKKAVLEANFEALGSIASEIQRLLSTRKKKQVKELIFEEPESWVPFRFVREKEFKILCDVPDTNVGIYEIHNSFLLKLGNAERNNFIAEEMKIDLELDDLLTEDNKNVYSTTDSENATKIQQNYCRMCVNLQQLRDFFFQKLVGARKSFCEPEILEDIFQRVVEKEANRLYDRVIQNFNQEMKKQYLSSSKNVKQMKYREKKKSELLEKKIELLQEQINKLLILETIRSTREECSELVTDLESETKVEKEVVDEYAPTKKKSVSKYELFQEFLGNIMRKGVLTRNKTTGTTISMLQSDLEDATDNFATKLSDWKQIEISFCRNSRDAMINRYKRISFLNEQKFQCSKYNHSVDKQSYKRRIEAEVVDKNFDLVFRVASVDRVNKHLEEQLNSIKEIAKNEVKKEYIDLVRSLYKEMLMVNEKYGSYKNNFFKEMQHRFKKVKKETVSKCKKKPSAFHEKALKVIREDNRSGRVKTMKKDTKIFVTKLKVLHKLRMMSLKGKYEKTIQHLESIIEENRKSFWGNKTKSEEREQILRQELHKIQNELSNSQMEVERLKKNLDSQKKNKREFTQWKVKNKQVIDELYKKVQRLEKWNSYNLDIEQLLLDKGNLEKEVQKFSKFKEKMSKKSRIINQKSDARLRDLERKLHSEKRLKEQAFSKLDLLQNNQVSLESQFEQRYYDAMSELKLAKNEITILKNILKGNKIEVPDFSDVTLLRGKRSQSGTLPKLRKKSEKSRRKRPITAQHVSNGGRDLGLGRNFSSRPVTVNYLSKRKFQQGKQL